jgi:hypothetical protein
MTLACDIGYVIIFFGLGIKATPFITVTAIGQQHYNNKCYHLALNVIDVSTLSALLYKFTSLDVLQH